MMASPPIELPRGNRFETLDHWRGLAALGVVIHHCTVFVKRRDIHASSSIADILLWIATHLWIGVPLFFVISGYCICASADSCRKGRHSVRTFFVRRFRRIYPPYWIAMGFGAVSIWLSSLTSFVGFRRLFASVVELTPEQWVGNVTLTETWLPLCFGQEAKFLLPVAWTLCYEEQFYIIVGLLLCISRRHLFAGLCTVTLLVIVNSVPFNSLTPGIDVDAWKVKWNGTFLRWVWLDFACGCALYYHLNHATKLSKRLIELAFIIGLVLTSQADRNVLELRVNIATSRFIALLFAIILLVSHRWDRSIASWRILRPLKICGTMCYSLYLIHDPITVGLSGLAFGMGLRSAVLTLCVTIPVCVGISLLAGWAFHLLVERHWLNVPMKSPTLKLVNQETTTEAPALSLLNEPA